MWKWLDYRNTAENTAEQKLKGLVLNQVESTYKDQLESSTSQEKHTYSLKHYDKPFSLSVTIRFCIYEMGIW